MSNRGMSADRIQRQQAIVRLLAAEPGLKRSQLAERFGLSERQVQSDLLWLSRGIYHGFARVALIRKRGYRLEVQALDVCGVVS